VFPLEIVGHLIHKIVNPELVELPFYKCFKSVSILRQAQHRLSSTRQIGDEIVNDDTASYFVITIYKAVSGSKKCKLM